MHWLASCTSQMQSGSLIYTSLECYLAEWPVCALGQVDACTWTSDWLAPSQIRLLKSAKCAKFLIFMNDTWPSATHRHLAKWSPTLYTLPKIRNFLKTFLLGESVQIVAKAKGSGVLLEFELFDFTCGNHCLYHSAASPRGAGSTHILSLCLFLTFCLATEYDKACIHCYATGFITLTTNSLLFSQTLYISSSHSWILWASFIVWIIARSSVTSNIR